MVKEISAVDIYHERRLFKEYLEHRVSVGTTRVYVRELARWLSVLGGDTPTTKSAQSYIDALANIMSPSTVNLRAHAIIKYFESKGIPATLDCPTVRYPEPKYKSMKDIKELLNHCNTILEQTLIIVLFDTAVRISELLNLHTDEIDWEMGLITVTRKGGRREDVNISPKALPALKRWLKVRETKSKLVFGDISYMDAWHIIKRVGRRAKITISPHMLRHSRAIQMLMSGATLHDVQNHLGHVNIATTANIYGRFKAVDLKKRIPSW